MAYIPVADQHEDTAVNQHLVPQCYMREWSYNPNETSVWLYDKISKARSVSPDEINEMCSKKLKKINAINNYYDIKAGFISMPQEALDEIFGPTMHLIVSLDNELLDTEEKRNNNFYLFDNWVITDNHNTPLTVDERDSLKKYFREARFVLIEKEWSKQYENNWRTLIKDIEQKVRAINNSFNAAKANGVKASNVFPADIISEVVKNLIIFSIRGYSSNDYFNEMVDHVLNLLPQEISDLEIEPQYRMHPSETTAKEELRHQFYLHLYYNILKGNDLVGPVKAVFDCYKRDLVLDFCLTDISNPFVTSERPVFVNTDDNGKKLMFFVTLPTMLIAFGKGKKEHCYISDLTLTPEKVTEYNKIIAKNNDLIISCTNQLDINTIIC